MKVRGFRAFLLRGNVVDLAVAVVVGAAFTSVVTAFVKDLMTPLIAAVFGKPEVGNLYFTINNSKFLFGDFINSIIAFLVAAFVIYYFVVLPINTLIERSHRHEKPADPTTKKCPECLSEIPIGAKRCAFCTQPVPV
jgi:large conductance mechanosensitive channel